MKTKAIAFPMPLKTWGTYFFIGRSGIENGSTELIAWGSGEIEELEWVFDSYEAALKMGRHLLLECRYWGVGAIWQTNPTGRLLVHDLATDTPPGFYNRGFGDF